MIKNYFKIALRNVLKHKMFSAINIFGLTVGMACCLFIFIYVQDELSFDSFHRDSHNIYRIALHGKVAGQEIYTTNSSYPVAGAMQQEIPGVEQTVRLWPRQLGMVMKNGDKAFTEKDMFFVDSTFFEFFSFQLIQGDPKTALRDPNSIVLTEATARKYFNDEDPMGQTLVVGNDNTTYKVTGISKPAPQNSHLQFNALLSMITVDKNFYKGWTGNSLQTYVRINNKTNVTDMNARLDAMVEKNVGPELEQGLGVNFAEFKKQGGLYAYMAYPLLNTHLYAKFNDDISPTGDITYVYIFAMVGIFILVIACINFMNLATAKSAGRAKEVGLRKTLGSQRSQMIWQFLSESFIYSLVAILLALVLCYILLPYFNLLSGKELSFDSLNSMPFYIGVASLIVLVGLLAGSYPAFYLTSFSAVEVLKGKVKAGMKSKGVRSSLVVIQFSISIFLILATAIVFNQISYMQNRNMGLDKDKVINLRHLGKLGKNAEAFKNEVLKQTGIEAASFTNNLLPGTDNTTVFREKGSDKDYIFGQYNVDYDYLHVLKIELKEGRFFSREFPSDTLSVVLNEAAVKEFGWELSTAVGREVLDFNLGPNPVVTKVVGVVKDYNFESMKAKIRPLILTMYPTANVLMIRYEGNAQQAIEATKQTWLKYASGEPFEYTFLDQNFDALFQSEMRLKNIFTVFSGIAIFVACLGLFALAAFTTEQRTKEIGIRKALGASTSRLTFILSKEFTILVIISFVPAAAAAWYFSGYWLDGFAYRTKVSPLLFVAGGLGALLVAWITVGFQSIKAARSNPVNSLRYE